MNRMRSVLAFMFIAVICGQPAYAQERLHRTRRSFLGVQIQVVRWPLAIEKNPTPSLLSLPATNVSVRAPH